MEISYAEAAIIVGEEDYGSVDESAFYQLAEALDRHPYNPSLEAGTDLLDPCNAEYIIDTQKIAVLNDQDQAAPQPSIVLAEADDIKVTKAEIDELENLRAVLNLTPYERFRARRNRLSISDLVAPMWCNTQFQYALEKTGKIRRTQAMKEGHKIHAALEREVHVTVPFELHPAVPEEQLGLKLLNIFSGLLELSSGHITRELPVLGFIHNVLVTGVIDELKFVEFESEHTVSRGLMTDYLQCTRPKKQRGIIVSDAKTRVSHREPASSQVDQARFQLMLYWDLLRRLPELDLSRLLEHENLDGQAPFSDDFARQALQMLGNTSDEFVESILSSNTIQGYWALLMPKLLEIQGALSAELEIKYIHQRTQSTIAVKKFQFDRHWVEEKTTSVMAWWKGQQEAEGVPIEEAYKCGICEFEAGCSWKSKKIQDHIELRRKQRTDIR